MAVKHGLGTYGNAVGTVTPEDHKLAQAGLIVKDTTGKVRAGLFYTGTETIVSGKANMSYDVAAFTAALTRGASSGAVLLANDGVVNVVTTAAPGSNSRYDVVYVWQREYSLDGTDSEPVIGVVQGTAAASPSVPSLSAFPGAIELARILVPAGVTATNSGTTITQKAPFTAAAGGVVHFRNADERDAETTLPIGSIGEVSGTHYTWDGSSWVNLVPTSGLVSITPASVAGSGVSLSGSVVTFVAASSVSLNGVFTAAYRNYLVLLDITTASTTLNPRLRLRASSTDDTGTNYGHQYSQSSGASVTAGQSGPQSSWQLGPDVSPSTSGSSRIEIFGPALASTTRGIAAATSASSISSVTQMGLSMFHDEVTAYNGFTVFPSTGNITGAVRIYGYN